MFTGIIERVSTVERLQSTADGVRFHISGLGLEDKVGPGDSVAVNGVCQTVEDVVSGNIVFTAVGETLKRTTMRSLHVGSRVNMETAATADSMLGGHIVQGHVDGLGTVQSFVRSGKDWLLSVRLSQDLLDLVVPKGSIAIDGVSLTVIDPKPAGVVTMTIVPFTFENTIIGDYRAGTRVNVEADILGKYVLQYLARIHKKR
ncbi:MAG: riboflavin synthase [Candidatus Latescibacterota bacterium]|nr:MAG: riboflavin synthase [Candidatus Latescibacterota bacterium]